MRSDRVLPLSSPPCCRVYTRVLTCREACPLASTRYIFDPKGTGLRWKRARRRRCRTPPLLVEGNTRLRDRFLRPQLPFGIPVRRRWLVRIFETGANWSTITSLWQYFSFPFFFRYRYVFEIWLFSSVKMSLSEPSILISSAKNSRNLNYPLRNVPRVIKRYIYSCPSDYFYHLR